MVKIFEGNYSLLSVLLASVWGPLRSIDATSRDLLVYVSECSALSGSLINLSPTYRSSLSVTQAVTLYNPQGVEYLREQLMFCPGQ